MKKMPTIERIQVNKLFDRFTYDINLKNGNNVAILIAPNGCGKTTIFNLIDFIFEPKITKLRKVISVPFDSCMCTLSNGIIIGVEKRERINRLKNDKEKNRKTRNESVHLMQDDTGEESIRNQLGDMREIYLVVNGEEKKIFPMPAGPGREVYEEEMDNYLSRVSYYERVKEYYESNEEEVEELPLRYRSMMERAGNLLEQPAFNLRGKYDCNIKINYISADRLHKQIPLTKEYSYRRRQNEAIERDPLATIQRNIVTLFTVTDFEYRQLVSNARDRLPKMYLDARDVTSKKFEKFKNEWMEYVADIDKLSELGLIDVKEKVLEIDQLEDAFREKGTFLTEYLKAFKPTLKPWIAQYDRMKLYADILNKRNRVTHKELKYGPKGLIILVDGKELPLECLSSGEKNDLIMFYNLIFGSEEGGLVLIDEPEISLHIEWQEDYLDCLLNICEMNKLHAIVATHSPNIVNGHFELYAERGIQDESER